MCEINFSKILSKFSSFFLQIKIYVARANQHTPSRSTNIGYISLGFFYDLLHEARFFRAIRLLGLITAMKGPRKAMNMLKKKSLHNKKKQFSTQGRGTRIRITTVSTSYYTLGTYMVMMESENYVENILDESYLVLTSVKEVWGSAYWTVNGTWRIGVACYQIKSA